MVMVSDHITHIADAFYLLWHDKKQGWTDNSGTDGFLCIAAWDRLHDYREQICLGKQQQRTPLKNNTGCLVTVNTATVCQEPFGSRKRTKANLGN